jgi:hemerythrin
MKDAAAPIWRLEWDESLSVHIPEIDAEHQHFIQMINDLNEAIVDRMDENEIKKRKQAILDNTVAHFAHEEALFKKWRYPETEKHAGQHEAVIQTLNNIFSDIKLDQSLYHCIEVGLKLKAILIEDFLSEDLKAREYFLKMKAL